MDEDQIKKWKTEGYCIIHNFLDEKLINEAVKTLEALIFPDEQEFGSDGKLEFPTDFDVLNDISLHPKIIKSAQQLLGTKDIRLMQSDYWKKINSGSDHYLSNSDQRIHMDFPNNYLTYPNDW